MKHYTHYLALLLLILAAVQSTPSAAREAQGSLSANTPLCFIENKGQITDQYGKTRKDIDFKVKANGLNIFIGAGAIHYQWYRSNKKEKRKNEKMGLPDDGKSSLGAYRMDVALLGANKNATLTENETNGYYENYYTEPIGLKGATAHSFKRITYKNVYPHIDWVLYINNGGLKYDFVVHPGGDVKNIRLQYNGATGLELKNGSLAATTPYGSITEQAPYTYTAETHKEIKSNFILNNNILSYNIALPLGSSEGMEAGDEAFIIDPKIDWATYLGGTGDDNGYAVCTDPSGNVYVAGNTSSTSNIATTGAYSTTLAGGNDAFVAKYNQFGNLAWASYYGGALSEFVQCITCDPAGNLYLAGNTTSTSGIATTGAHQSSFGGSGSNGSGDVFLAKFGSGGGLLWATYYGGSDDDFYGAVSTDASGNVYLCGVTRSSNGIATPLAHQTSPGSLYDGFLAKFNSSGVRQWGTYIGGADNDQAHSVSCDASGNVIVAGTTSSFNGIGTAGTHRPNKIGFTADDVFINKFSSTGTRTWGSYYGGVSNDQAFTVTTDPSDNIYITGETTSDTGIATSGAYQVTRSGNFDGLVAKFNSSGVLQWGTFVGGVGLERTTGIVYSGANIYVSGYTQSSSSIATANGYHTSLSGSSDNFFVQLSANGASLLYGSYFGGGSSEGSFCGLTKTAGALYLCGSTASNSSIATTGAQQAAYGGGINDLYLAKFIVDTIPYIRQPFTDTLLCAGDTLRLGFEVAFKLNTSNIFTAQLSNAAGSFTSPVNIGTLASDTSGTIVCIIPAGTATGTGYRVRVTGSAPAITGTDNFKNIAIGNGLNKPVINSNSPVCTGSNFNMTVTNPLAGATYTWTGPGSFSATGTNTAVINVTAANAGNYFVLGTLYGCKGRDTEALTVLAVPAKPVITSNTPVCSGNTLNLNSTAISGVTYNWTGPNSFTASTQNTSVTNTTIAAAGNYILTVTNSANCSSKDTETVVIQPTPVINATNSSPACAGSNVNLFAAISPSGTTNSWTGPSSFSSFLQNPIISAAGVAATGDYIITATLNGCTGKDTTAVTVYPIPPAPVAGANTPVCIYATLNLTASPVSGATYSWSGPNNFIAGSQNPSRPNISAGDSGTYYVTASVNGCTSAPGSVKVSVNPTPFVTIYAVPGDTICTGTNVTFIALTANGSPAATYKWTKNSSPTVLSTTTTYSSASLNHNDVIRCEMTESTKCSTPYTDTSNEITMVVLNVAIPSVTISTTPTGPVPPYQLVTFTAITANGGPAPHYQWTRNGKDIVGALSAVWGTAQLDDKDTICVIMTSSFHCAVPQADTACTQAQIMTDIHDTGDGPFIRLYPNPNVGQFVVEASGLHVPDAGIIIFSATGQVVYKQNINLAAGNLKQNIDLGGLAAGVYLLKLEAGGKTYTQRFTVDR